MADYFIQGAVEHPGRVHKYIMREFGKQAFHRDGTIKDEYLDRALERVKERKNTSLERAVILAKRLKGYAKEKERL